MLKRSKRIICNILMSFVLMGSISSQLTVVSYATDFNAEAEARKSDPVESNNIENWPDGPLIGADAAILIEADTGTILYSKNIYKKEYPASITKILTALLAIEKGNLNDVITFSDEAVFSVPGDASGMGMDVNEQITMEQAMYGLLVGSANEAANGIAEHIAGSIPEFAKLMNEKAKELGCNNSNFLNTNGLFDENHYTCAYDMAQIAREFFRYELLCKMSSTESYNIPISATQPDDIWVHSHHRLLKGRQFSYEYFVGGKTGYTDNARQTLVSCAEKDGMRLICVILREESPAQFSDTVDLFNYGFSNFQKLNISEHESRFTINNHDFFESDTDVFGNSNPLIELNQSSSIVLPVTAEFDDAEYTLSYEVTDPSSVAEIDYTYQGVSVGSTTVDFVPQSSDGSWIEDVSDNASGSSGDSVAQTTEKKVIFVNVKKIVLWMLGMALFVIIIFVIRSFIRNYHFSRRRRSRIRRKRRKKMPTEFDRFNF